MKTHKALWSLHPGWNYFGNFWVAFFRLGTAHTKKKHPTKKQPDPVFDPAVMPLLQFSGANTWLHRKKTWLKGENWGFFFLQPFLYKQFLGTTSTTVAALPASSCILLVFFLVLRMAERVSYRTGNAHLLTARSPYLTEQTRITDPGFLSITGKISKQVVLWLWHVFFPAVAQKDQRVLSQSSWFDQMLQIFPEDVSWVVWSNCLILHVLQWHWKQLVSGFRDLWWLHLNVLGLLSNHLWMFQILQIQMFPKLCICVSYF